MNPFSRSEFGAGEIWKLSTAEALPSEVRIGESWEICDRPGDESVVANGPLRGRSLHGLMEECAADLVGPRSPMPARFPLLIKIIDAQDTLSLQVHPPASVAVQLGGEPKTEMWYVARAEPGAELFAGLKRGVSRADFERKLADQTVAECFHRLPVKEGDSLFLRSGRVHALGAGTVIFEIQQNSDTTYRVFDWNRVDCNGKPRELHVPQSLASIDFNDFEPALAPRAAVASKPGTVRSLVQDELFKVNLRQWSDGDQTTVPTGKMCIIGVVKGALRIGETVALKPGNFCLIPAQCEETVVRALGATSFLEVT